MLRSGWWVAFAALGIVAACDLNPQPEVPAEQSGVAGQKGGLGGTGGVLNAGGSAGTIGSGAGGALDLDAMPDDALAPSANDASDADADADADAENGDAELDASAADAAD